MTKKILEFNPATMRNCDLLEAAKTLSQILSVYERDHTDTTRVWSTVAQVADQWQTYTQAEKESD